MLLIDALTKSADQITEKYDRDYLSRKYSTYLMVSGMIIFTETMIGFSIGGITDNRYVFLVTFVSVILQSFFFLLIVGGK